MHRRQCNGRRSYHPDRAHRALWIGECTDSDSARQPHFTKPLPFATVDPSSDQEGTMTTTDGGPPNGVATAGRWPWPKRFGFCFLFVFLVLASLPMPFS